MTAGHFGRLAVLGSLLAVACTGTPVATDSSPSTLLAPTTAPSPETIPATVLTTTTRVAESPPATAPEGSTLVEFSEAPARLAIPTEWMVVDLEDDDLDELIGTLGPANRPLVALIEGVRDRGDGGFLLMAFAPGSEGYTENLNVTYTAEPVEGPRLVELTAYLIEQAGGTVTEPTGATSEGHPTATVRYRLPIETADGTVETFGLSHSIVLGGGYLTVTLSSDTPEELLELEARVLPTIHLLPE